MLRDGIKAALAPECLRHTCQGCTSRKFSTVLQAYRRHESSRPRLSRSTDSIVRLIKDTHGSVSYPDAIPHKLSERRNTVYIARDENLEETDVDIQICKNHEMTCLEEIEREPHVPKHGWVVGT